MCGNSVNSQIKLTHNAGAGPLETIMFTCVEDEYWARTYILEDFGVAIDSESYVLKGEIAFYRSYAGATAKFNIYAIDENFPQSFPSAILLGSSQIEPIPWYNGPETMILNFETPVEIPPNVERILVEVQKGDDPNSFFSPLAYAAGSEFENDYSYYKGCGQNFTYKTTANLNPPRPNANFIVNAIVDKNLSNYENTMEPFTLYPIPTRDILKVKSKLSLQDFKIYTITGTLLIEDSISETIDVSVLESGIYFFETIIDGTRIIRKFLKL